MKLRLSFSSVKFLLYVTLGVSEFTGNLFVIFLLVIPLNHG